MCFEVAHHQPQAKPGDCMGWVSWPAKQSDDFLDPSHVRPGAV